MFDIEASVFCKSFGQGKGDGDRLGDGQLLGISHLDGVFAPLIQLNILRIGGRYCDVFGGNIQDDSLGAAPDGHVSHRNLQIGTDHDGDIVAGDTGGVQLLLPLFRGDWVLVGHRAGCGQESFADVGLLPSPLLRVFQSLGHLLGQLLFFYVGDRIGYGHLRLSGDYLGGVPRPPSPCSGRQNLRCPPQQSRRPDRDRGGQ